MTIHGEMRIKIDTPMMLSGEGMGKIKDHPTTEADLTVREMEEVIPMGIGNSSIRHLTFVNRRLHFEEDLRRLTVGRLPTFEGHRQVSINGVREEVVLEEVGVTGVDQAEAVVLLNGTTEKDLGILIVVVVGD
jgi:hypothetical protein